MRMLTKAVPTTATKQKLRYARLFVELPLNLMYPDRIIFENELGQVVAQEVEY